MAKVKCPKRQKEIWTKLSALGIDLPACASNGHNPLTEADIARILAAVEKGQQVLRTTTQDVESYRKNLEKELRALLKEQGETVLAERDVLPIPPQLLDIAASTVGDLNFLLDPVPLTVPVVSRLLRNIAQELISTTDGLLPNTFGIFDFVDGERTDLRLVTKWTLRRAPHDRDLHGLFEITKQAYGEEIRGPKGEGKGWDAVIAYRDAQDNIVAKRLGLYFGPSNRFYSGARGLLVTRSFGYKSEFNYLSQRFPEDWMARSIDGSAIKQFELELREGGTSGGGRAGLAQAEFLCLVVQLAYFLKQGALINRRSLAIAVFRALNRLGAEGASRAKLYGLRGVLETIERVLLLPLQQPRLAQAYRFPPESTLLVGVPGVGKTLLAKFLMSQGYNCIFVSVDTTKLLLDLTDPKGSSILLQIDKIGQAAGLPVTLLVDDIDAVMGKEERDTTLISKLLNLFQGVREKGFFIIASTNYPERIDARLLEPGRLSKVVHVPLPGYEDRIGILTLHLEGVPFASEAEREDITAQMAKTTSGWTGRYLRALVHEAGRVSSLALIDGNLDSARPFDQIPPLNLEHFKQAQALILAGVDMGKFQKEDERIQKFVSLKGGVMGFKMSGTS